MYQHERRAKQRYPVQFPILVAHRPANGDLRGVTRDVGSKGVFFYMSDDTRLELSEPIEFRMILPSLTDIVPVVCRGTVVRLEVDEHTKTGVAATIESYKFG